MAQRVAYSALKPLVDKGEITADQIAAKVQAGEIEVVDDRNGDAVAAAPSPQPTDAPVEGRSVGGFLHNAVDSGVKLVGDIGTAIAHPLQTAEAVGKTVVGAAQKGAVALGAPAPAERGLDDYRGNADALLGHMKQRYGGWDNAKKTAYEDPIGFALDLSAVLSGGGAAAGRLGLRTVGRALTAAGEIVDPIRAVTKGATAAVGAAAGNRVTGAVLGKTTGVGTNAVETAAKAGDSFTKGMRGETTIEDVVGDVKQAAQDLADRRASEYQAQLAKLPPTTVTTRPLIAELRQQIANFGGTVKAVQKGGKIEYVVDFSGANAKLADAKEIATVQDVIDDVARNAASGASDARALDAMKIRLGQRLGAGKFADKIITATQDAARRTLEQSVPGYADMTKDYAEASQLLDKVTSEFSTKGGAAKEGASVRKLTMALNQNNEFRRALIDILDNELGTHIRESLAGVNMSAIAPRGIMGPLAGGIVAVKAASNPAALFALSLTSPRFVGEALRAISKARRAARAMPAVAPAVAPVRDVVASNSIQ
jgi:hypothetical protein